MSRLGRTLVVLVLALGPALAFAAPAHACSCIGGGTLEEEIAGAEVAFKGDIVEIPEEGTYRVRVSEVYRGSVPETVEVFAQSERTSSCGITLPLGPIVYIGERDLQVHLCGASRYGATAQEADTSGIEPKYSPSPTASPSPTGVPLSGGDDSPGLLPVVAAWGLGGASLAALGAAVWARRAKPLPPAS